jgi:Cu+-exporting ATPase
MDTLTRLFLSCAQTIEDVLSTLTPPPYSVDVSIVRQSVRIRHNPKLDRVTIELAIETAGFDLWFPTPHNSPATTKRESVSQNTSGILPAKHRKHIARCSFCKSVEALAQDVPRLSTSGGIPEVPEFPAEEEGPVALSLSIGGMTCAACSNTLTRLLSEVDGVSEAVVDLMGHSARVVVESQRLTPIVVETIEDAGFDAEVVKAEPLVKAPAKETTTRTISLKVDGMFCRWGVPGFCSGSSLTKPFS